MNLGCIVLQPNFRKLIAGEHPYIPQTGPTHFDIDADMIRDGDTIMCPTHKNTVVLVFGTNWWKLMGNPMKGYGWINGPSFTASCRDCIFPRNNTMNLNKELTFTPKSYAG